MGLQVALPARAVLTLLMALWSLGGVRADMAADSECLPWTYAALWVGGEGLSRSHQAGPPGICIL